MNSRARVVGGLVGLGMLLVGSSAVGQDWPQWRGPNRDGRVAAFTAPSSWPAELTKKWQVSVGDGVATPALVDGRLYVFSREDGEEVTRCLDAATGDEIWRDAYESEGSTGGAAGFPGPRSSPTVVDGKVITLGVRGVLSCLDAETSTVLWRKDDFHSWPMFYVSSSPIVVDGVCIAQLGGSESGGIVAYDLETGDERWRWTGDSPSYASPVLMKIDGSSAILAPTDKHFVALDAANGNLLWQIQFTQGRYNVATPTVDGKTIIMAGPGSGMSAIAVEKQGDELAEEQLWNNTDNSVQFNSPVLKDGLIFGLSNNNTLFCINASTHETAWSEALGGAEPPGGGPFGGFGRGGPGNREGRPRGEGRGDREGGGERRGPPGDAPAAAAEGQQASDGEQATDDGRERRRGEAREGERERRGFGRGGGRRRGGRGGYGSLVDAGPVLMVLTPATELVVFEPTDQGFNELARYKVAETPTYAHPVVAGERIYIKDQDSVALWLVE